MPEVRHILQSQFSRRRIHEKDTPARPAVHRKAAVRLGTQIDHRGGVLDENRPAIQIRTLDAISKVCGQIMMHAPLGHARNVTIAEKFPAGLSGPTGDFPKEVQREMAVPSIANAKGG